MADQDSRRGHGYLTEPILDWLTQTHLPPDEALSRAFDAPKNHGLPPIQVSPAEGKLVAMLMSLIGARRVVEVGTLAGYSAIWIARALGPEGHLWTIESDPAHAEIARQNLDAAGLGDRVTVLTGLALDVLPTLADNAPFCAVFVDADKGNYDRYGAWATEVLRPGGLLVGDNALFFGDLLADDDPSAAAMRRFHEDMARHYDSVCIPTPDGIAVGRRNSA